MKSFFFGVVFQSVLSVDVAFICYVVAYAACIISVGWFCFLWCCGWWLFCFQNYPQPIVKEENNTSLLKVTYYTR